MTSTPRIFACFITLMTFCLAALALPPQDAPGVVTVSANLDKRVLDNHLEYLPDPDHQFRLEQLVGANAGVGWQDKSAPDARVLLEGGLYWFRVTLRNADNADLNLLVQTKYPAINVADLYQVTPDGQVQTIYADAGLEDRFANRPVPHRNLINGITLPANGSLTLIWRIDSDPLLQFSASLWQPTTFGQWDLSVQLIHGLLYGMLLIMTIYNLFLFFSTWDRSYFYFVAYIATILYLIAAQQGHIYQYVAPDEVWAKMSIYVIVYCLNSLMFGQFTITFLNLRKRSRRLMWAIRVIAVLSAVFPVIVMITGNLLLVFTTLSIIMLLYALALIAGIVVRMQGVISAGHFVIAIMVLAFSLLASNMAALGLISSNELTEHLTAIGATLMGVFFSLALADRINQLQKEVRQANRTIKLSNEEKLKAEAELRKLKEQRIRLEQVSSQARRESRSKSNFLATLSHEIRTPMNGVLGMTELMKSTRLDEKQTYYLNTIEHSGKTLLAIINDLQDFAKIEAGKMELELSSFNLESLIDDCIATFALRAIEKNINFIADIDPGIEPVLRGDASKLQQIILNLLSNAFKFTEQGDIVLVVSNTNKPAINSVELRFEVRDSGIGLTDEEQRRLFTPFQQADDSTYGRYGGSGIGLAISKQLAELMDGQIGVNSESGKGSSFWFTARLLVDEHPDEALIRKKSTLLQGKELLLVDTNAISADIISRLLQSWQMQVQRCDDIDTALAALAERRFDVVLADYNLGDSDGVELAKQISKTGSFHGSFVLMAAARHLKNQQELLQLGVHLVLEKPVTTALMHDILKRAVSEQEASTESLRSEPEVMGIPDRVLVVEDNQVNQMVILGLLRQLGIQADTAVNGLEAIALYDREEYGLILMDCDMPEMDGYEATAQIRGREQHNGRPRTPIIALSAHARSDYQQRATDSGMDGYLTKPITLSELAAVVRERTQASTPPPATEN